MANTRKSGGRSSPAPQRASRARLLRIIGGRWRGRRLRFPALPEIRPTPDRVRETLFNWLASRVPDASCLDLFAGSGALGLEALSRGAAHVTFVETAPLAVRELRARLAEWGAANALVEEADALRFLTSARGTAPRALGTAPRAFDIVFMDPPFSSGLLSTAATLLESGDWLAKGAYVYVETPAGVLPDLPASWVETRAKKAGSVGYHLLTRS